MKTRQAYRTPTPANELTNLAKEWSQASHAGRAKLAGKLGAAFGKAVKMAAAADRDQAREIAKGCLLLAGRVAAGGSRAQVHRALQLAGCHNPQAITNFAAVYHTAGGPDRDSLIDATCKQFPGSR